MRLTQSSVNNLKPDPNQPRQAVDKNHIKEMAQNMLTEGVINPVEIDKENVIVTGEMRWRAAKEAGLQEIPTKVIDPGSANDRYLRQVSENIHHNTMTPWDTANAIKRLYNVSTSLHAPDKYNPNRDEGIRDLARQLGKSAEYIRQMLSLLEETEAVKKAIKEDGLNWTYIRDANKAPEEFREVVKEKILKGELKNQEGITAVARALHRSPEKAEEILAPDYSNKTREEIISQVKEISPTPIDQIADATEKATKIINITEHLTDCLVSTRLSELPPFQQPRISSNLIRLMEAIKEFNQPRKKELQGGLNGN